MTISQKIDLYLSSLRDEYKIKKVIVSLSGGPDSGTLTHFLCRTFSPENVYAITFDYGQSGFAEKRAASLIARRLKVKSHQILNVSFLSDFLANACSIIQGSKLRMHTPSEANKEDKQKHNVYVPFRNLVFSSITLSIAESVGANGIGLGMHFGDYSNPAEWYFWDCTVEFVNRLQKVADLNDRIKIMYIAPFLGLDKSEIIKAGIETGFDYSITWSCYQGNKVGEVTVDGKSYDVIEPCKVCQSCYFRLEAFKKNNVEDPLKEILVEKN